MSTLSISEFHRLVDQLYAKLEDLLDHSEADIDIENSQSVLTLQLENSSQIIFSRQEALSQLWIAARSGGYHLGYQPKQQGWYCTASNETLPVLLTRLFNEQGENGMDFGVL